jgi:opacity protein-like surface antigen
MYSKLLLAILWIYSTNTPALEKNYYFQISGGHSISSDAYLHDYVDENSDLPLLFGLPEIGAEGDFGNSNEFDLALGKIINDKFSVEIAYTKFSSLSFEGNANFINSGDIQPSSSDVKSHAVMLNSYYHFKPRHMTENIKFQPYLGIGLGQAFNKMAPVVFEFPEFDQGTNGEIAASITASGKRNNFAKQFISGLKFPITSAIDLDIKYKYIDHGRVQTNQGDLRILRYHDDGSTALDTEIEIQTTTARLKSHNFMLGFTFNF